MDEKIKARYIDPMVDWSFKRLFGSEVNKDILIEFLKVIFPEHEIEDITYIPAEQLGIMEDDRKAVFDVICRTKEGKDFLVEMQCATQKHFFERALYYTSFPIMNQGKKAQRDEETGIKKAWNYELDGVYFLGVLNFKYEDDDLIEHRYLLREATTGKTMTDKLKFVFVEVEKFNKSEDELTTDFDKWLYILKNLSKLLERPAALRDRIFSRLFDVAEYASLDNIDKQNYVKAMTTARDTHNQIEYAKETGLEEGLAKGRAEGREEGRAEGLEEGFEKGRYDMILKMVQNDLPIQTICEITGLSLEEVAKLKDSSGR
ncbi:MAG: Rpn family recombination-promoting nuclease/putative transposase [Bacteroidales bacterium]|jgi:predicted transposase/invertase (TIGR01784 family)|nr:Rpn family recombination-promoting nuclease/putative transposase [Bacteroidales bacterium]